jgi:N-methylhydantoinase A
MAEYAIALDVGGTFTDVTLVELESGQVWSLKTPTTPDDPSAGFTTGVQQALAAAGITGADLARVFHATTTATNAILEDKGVKTGLITTEGFRYVLEIGRHDGPRRTNKYLWVKPKRPVPPERVLEVRERIDKHGQIEEPLDEERCRAIAARFRDDGVESIAISLLYSYANDAHERRAAALVREVYPEAQLSLSADVLPVFREYERSMATVLNAYVMPLVGSYIGLLRRRLAELGVRAPFHVMKSNGGLVSPEVVQVQPVTTALSGPAAGVMGATQIARAAGYDDLISIDMGGTSADVCLVEGGQPETTEEGQVGTWPLHLPMIDVHTIGAGGGSIASVNAEGVLEVGPASAGARPGPVCYAHGGTEPTVTDANLVLGRIPPYLLGGTMPLDRDAALAAIQTRIAEPLGLDPYAAASGILEIVDNNMMGAIRVVSIERGHDPRDYVLVPCGGAGPLHGTALADLLAMPAVVVPARPGVLSTFGLLFSDLRNDFARTHVRPLAECDPAELQGIFRDLEAQARAWQDTEGIPPAARGYEWFATMRYVAQMFELTLQWPVREVNAAVVDQMTRAFHQRHQQTYTYCSEDAPVEIVTLRVQATGALQKLAVPRVGPPSRPTLGGADDGSARPPTVRGENVKRAAETQPSSPQDWGAGGADPAPVGTRDVYFTRGEGFVPTPVYDRDHLAPGATFAGPAVVEQMDSNTLVPPGWACRLDEYGNLILERQQAQ